MTALLLVRSRYVLYRLTTTLRLAESGPFCPAMPFYHGSKAGQNIDAIGHGWAEGRPTRHVALCDHVSNVPSLLGARKPFSGPRLPQRSPHSMSWTYSSRPADSSGVRPAIAQSSRSIRSWYGWAAGPSADLTCRFAVCDAQKWRATPSVCHADVSAAPVAVSSRI